MGAFVLATPDTPFDLKCSRFSVFFVRSSFSILLLSFGCGLAACFLMFTGWPYRLDVPLLWTRGFPLQPFDGIHHFNRFYIRVVF